LPGGTSHILPSFSKKARHAAPRSQESYSAERYNREDVFLSLQPGMRKGDARNIEVTVKVVFHKADLNGYRAPAKLVAGRQKMTDKGGGELTPEIVR
jgi:hypothetical protein